MMSGRSELAARRVRVWYDRYAIADYRADPVTARRYAAAMRRRFAGLRVTNEPLTDTDPPPPITLPPQP